MASDDAEDKDQSMEEILQSIKRIIAEEGESVPASDASPQSDDDEEILDLTETVADPIPVAPAAPRTERHFAERAPLPSSSADEQQPERRDVLADIDSLLSDDTVRQSTAALRALTDAQAPGRGARDISRAEPAFRSGGTVEDLVLEALRPMLKDWLDENLPGIVQDLVAKEIKKLSH